MTTPIAPAAGALTAIQTEYNGYLFRSRLEARWAYYFDQCGIRWQYEAEGFTLSDGQRYLPDFWLPDYNQFIEVKPDTDEAHVSVRPLVYMAGKMGTPTDNKRTGPCWRPMDVDIGEYDAHPGPLPVRRMDMLGVAINYCGPWKGYEENHGYWHGVVTTGCGNMGLRTIYDRNISAINACTEFFALLTDKTAYGTLFETGFAAAKGKAIVVGVKTQDTSHYFVPDDHNWFASMSAGLIIEGRDDAEVVAKYADYLRAKYPETKYDVMMRDAAMAAVGFRIVMGDPRTMKTKANGVTRELPYNQAAADAARQVRFGK